MRTVRLSTVYTTSDDRAVPVHCPDIGRTLSNVVTVYLSGNHESYVGSAPRDEVMIALLELISVAGNELTKTIADTKLLKELEVRQALRQVDDIIKNLVTLPLRPKHSVEDYSAATMTALASKQLVSVKLKFSKMLGRIAEYVSLDLSTGALRLGYVPSPCSDLSRAFALVLIILDAFRLSKEAIPVWGSARHTSGGDAAVLRGFSDLETYVKQVIETYGVGALYRCQLAQLLINISQYAASRVGTMLVARVPTMGSRVARLEAGIQRTKDKVPLHTLCSWVVSAYGSLKLRSRYHGPVQAVVVPGAIPASHEALLTDLAASLMESYGGQKGIYTWGTPPKDGKSVISIAEYEGQINCLGDEVFGAWPNRAKSLGWVPVSIESFEHDYHEPPLMFSDGDKFSHNPALAVLGLRTIVSARNSYERNLSSWAQVGAACATDRPSTVALPVKGRYAPENNWHVWATFSPVGSNWGENGGVKRRWPDYPANKSVLSSYFVPDDIEVARKFMAECNPWLEYGQDLDSERDWHTELKARAGKAVKFDSSLFSCALTSDDLVTIRTVLDKGPGTIAKTSQVETRDEPYALRVPVLMQDEAHCGVLLFSTSGTPVAGKAGMLKGEGLVTNGPPIPLTFDSRSIDLIVGSLSKQVLDSRSAEVGDATKLVDIKDGE